VFGIRGVCFVCDEYDVIEVRCGLRVCVCGVCVVYVLCVYCIWGVCVCCALCM